MCRPSRREIGKTKLRNQKKKRISAAVHVNILIFFMSRSRSATLKMYSEEAERDRQISSFSPPFSAAMTPYEAQDFSEIVKDACKSLQPLITSLKISKAIFLGDVAVGKTSLINRYCHHVFDSNYKTTIGVDFEVERFDILKVPFNLQIWDTAGQERFKCIASSYYRGAQVAAIMFDLTNLHSMSHCPQWLDEVLACNPNRPFVFLVGTKRDLLSSAAYRQVEAQASSMAKQLRAEYWAVSSRTGENVADLFLRMAVLAFESSVRAEAESSAPSITLGTNLLTLNIPENAPKKKQVNCANCSN